MPITLPPLSRRQFLRTTLATGATLALSPRLLAQQTPANPDRFALLSDTHIAGDRQLAVRGTKMAENLSQVGRELTALEERPAAVLVNGDCAYLHGQTEDYATLVDLIAPVREHGLAVHLALGNHDHRERFWEAIPRQADAPALEKRHLTVLQSPRANWFVLDSLDETNKTPGVLGDEQLSWLAAALDRHADKPAVVMLHHNPDERPKPGGLIETQALFDLLLPRKQAKLLLFGHTHNWSVTERDGLHLVNLPPVAYVFAAGKPNGWIDLRLADGGATLQLNCLDKQHADHGQRVELTWRS
jgi:3',5'-cyclic-AMP phosphodiesterase